MVSLGNIQQNFVEYGLRLTISQLKANRYWTQLVDKLQYSARPAHPAFTLLALTVRVLGVVQHYQLNHSHRNAEHKKTIAEDPFTAVGLST